MENCLFCKIVKGDIPSTKVYEDETILAFRDIAPMAPTHIFEVIPTIAAAEKLEGGYRVVSNCGPDAGQTVHHLHFHILGGKTLSTEMA